MAASKHVGTQTRCRFDPDHGMFLVLESTGKSLSSGGFGVTIPSKSCDEKLEESSSDDGGANECHSPQYLFIEEVLFLLQSGSLECLSHESEEDLLCAARLFSLLPKLNLSLPLYLVYAHLRGQDFRVLRHAPERYEILRKQAEIESADISRCNSRVIALRHRVRESVARTPAPVIESGKLEIAWDAYLPSSEFAKTHPGFPDFYVAVTYFNESNVTFDEIDGLLRQKSNEIPVKVATVSDSGTVVMFSATDFGVPSIGTREGD